MSNASNDIIRERAIEAREMSLSTVWEKQIDKAIEDDDLELMRQLTIEIENYNRVFEEQNDSY